MSNLFIFLGWLTRQIKCHPFKKKLVKLLIILNPEFNNKKKMKVVEKSRLVIFWPKKGFSTYFHLLTPL